MEGIQGIEGLMERRKEERKEGRKERPCLFFGYELVMFYTILLIMSIDSIQILLLDHERMNFHLSASANTI